MKYIVFLATAILFIATSTIHLNAQDMNPKITTFLMFEGDAEEAMEFYTSLFDDSEIIRIKKYGTENPHGPKAQGKVQHALFTMNGKQYMAIDSFGHQFSFTPSMSLFVQCDSEEELDTLYEKLMDGGTAAMPLDNYGFSEKFGWVQDKYGVSWQLNYGDLKHE